MHHVKGYPRQASWHGTGGVLEHTDLLFTAVGAGEAPLVATFKEEAADFE